LAQQEDESDEL